MCPDEGQMSSFPLAAGKLAVRALSCCDPGLRLAAAAAPILPIQGPNFRKLRSVILHRKFSRDRRQVSVPEGFLKPHAWPSEGLGACWLLPCVWLPIPTRPLHSILVVFLRD